MESNESKIETRRFWLGALLIVAGVVMLYLAMYLEPRGKVDGTILGAAGEMFVLGGSLLGLDSYVNYKIKKYLGNGNGNNLQ